MEQSQEHDAVKDGLERELREYALNPFVKVEICHLSDSEGSHNDTRDGLVSN